MSLLIKPTGNPPTAFCSLCSRHEQKIWGGLEVPHSPGFSFVALLPPKPDWSLAQRHSCLPSPSSVLNVCKSTPLSQRGPPLLTLLFGISSKCLAWPGEYLGGVFISVGTVALAVVRQCWSQHRRVGIPATASPLPLLSACTLRSPTRSWNVPLVCYPAGLGGFEKV